MFQEGALHVCSYTGRGGVRLSHLSVQGARSQHSGVTQVPTGGQATVLQDGAEVGGRRGAAGGAATAAAAATGRLSGRERLHGGEDEGQTVGHIFVWGARQSWSVSCMKHHHHQSGRYCGVAPSQLET